MNHPRETIYAAIFAQLQSAGAVFSTYSRKLLKWDQVDASIQPALFMSQIREGADQNAAFGLTRWTGRVLLYIYARVDELPTTAGSSTLNPLLDAVESALASTPPGEKQTLGGLVNELRIDGEILIDEGLIDGQAIAAIPLVFTTGI
jgi:hypothetical protein